MKNFTKICLIICAVLAGLGIIGCVAGIGMGFNYRNVRTMVQNGDFSFPGKWAHFWNDRDYWSGNWDNYDYVDDGDYVSEDDGDYSTETYGFDINEVRSLDGEFEYGQVTIERSESDQLEVDISYRKYWDGYERNISCYVGGGTLTIEDQIDDGFWNLFRNRSKKAYLTLRIPDGFAFDDFEFDGSAGSIVLNTAVQARDVDLSVDAGEVSYGSLGSINAAGLVSLSVDAGSMKLQDVTAGELDVECGVGQIDLDQVRAGSAYANCDVGQIEMNMLDKETDYNYSVQCDVGSVKIGNTNYSGLDSYKEKHYSDGNREFQVECGMGQIKVTFEN